MRGFELTQLTRGSTSTQGFVAPLGGVWIASAQSALPLIVRGRAPAAHVTLLIADSAFVPARVGLHPIGEGRSAILGCGAQVDLFMPEGCRLFAVCIPDCAGRDRPPLPGGALPKQHQSLVVSADREHLHWLVRWARSVARRLQETPIARGSKRRLQRGVLNASHRVLESARPLGEDDDAIPLRQRAVMRARDLVRDRLSQRISLVDLCGMAQVRARALEYGFRELYGMSPIAYIRCERLCRVHDDLLAASRAVTSVTETATRWGFAHMSQFAKDYRMLFGERPSATLLGKGRTSGAIHWLRTDGRSPHSAA